MTAYGRAHSNSDSGDYICEIRSVNHRYLDVSLRLDDTLRAAESMVRERVAARLDRGKVDVLLGFSSKTSAGNRLSIDHHLLDSLLDACDQVAPRCADKAPVDVVSLLQWPGVVTTETAVNDHSIEKALKVFDQALDDHVAARIREGGQISKALAHRAGQLQQIVSMLAEHRPRIVERQREKLLAKLQQLPTEPDSGRLEQELVYVAQRLDVDEELDRLEVHIQELHNVLKRNEAVGRRLDFLMQEFNREANTVASKSNDSETTAHSVNMKVLIEQMREQVQNVE